MNLLFCSRNSKEIHYGEKLVVDEKRVSKWMAEKDSEGVDWMQLVQHSIRRQCGYYNRTHRSLINS